jgi:hypothetical protein
MLRVWSSSPFVGIVAGQPTLSRQLRMGMFAALDQRIALASPSALWIPTSPPPTAHHMALAG